MVAVGDVIGGAWAHLWTKKVRGCCVSVDDDEREIRHTHTVNTDLTHFFFIHSHFFSQKSDVFFEKKTENPEKSIKKRQKERKVNFGYCVRVCVCRERCVSKFLI